MRPRPGLVDLKQAGLITRLVNITDVRAELLTRDRKAVQGGVIASRLPSVW
jgi:hypothetical protein